MTSVGLVVLAAALLRVAAWAPPAARRAPRRVALRAAATEKTDEFTVIGNDGKRVSLSKGEKERVFIDAIQSYYFDGRQVLSDADFDLLKEDLAWEGSEYAVLSRNETRFLGAMGAYSRGEEPIMSDDEFDALKASLKAQGSIVACSTEPRCFLDTGICSVAFCAETNRWVRVPCELYEPRWRGALETGFPHRSRSRPTASAASCSTCPPSRSSRCSGPAARTSSSPRAGASTR